VCGECHVVERLPLAAQAAQHQRHRPAHNGLGLPELQRVPTREQPAAAARRRRQHRHQHQPHRTTLQLLSGQQHVGLCSCRRVHALPLLHQALLQRTAAGVAAHSRLYGRCCPLLLLHLAPGCSLGFRAQQHLLPAKPRRWVCPRCRVPRAGSIVLQTIAHAHLVDSFRLLPPSATHGSFMCGACGDTADHPPDHWIACGGLGGIWYVPTQPSAPVSTGMSWSNVAPPHSVAHRRSVRAPPPAHDTGVVILLIMILTAFIGYVLP
jgi:hypothetical protein